MHIRCPHCQEAIEVGGEQEFTNATCPSCGSSFNLLPPTEPFHTPIRTIGRFQLLELVGTGGFGSVWKAKDVELDRLVAVKIPRNDQVNEDDATLFLREARAAAQLKHPHIVAVHEVGRENNTLYIVSDFVEGVTLADRLTAGSLSFREAAELCAQVADALHYAHEAGVIHRDLKPQNIMLERNEAPSGDDIRHHSLLTASYLPRIVDFGLAKREAGEVTMTVDGKVLGTPAYMSPEQARGEGHAVDRRTDVYSLGVILFEMLTGELPFRGNRAMLLNQVLHDDSPSPRKFNSRVPRDLETICLKCLEKDPHRRYATAADVAAELRRLVRGEPVVARPISRTERAWRWSRRNPVVAGLSTGVLALLASVALVSTWAYVRVSGDAAANSRLAREKTKLAEDMTSLAKTEKSARLDAHRQLRIATAERLTAQSVMLLSERPVTATLLAVEAVEATTLFGEPARPSAVQMLHDALANVGGRPLLGHGVSIPLMTISPDGRWLATASKSNLAARVWDLQAPDPGAAVRVLQGHKGVVLCLAISPDSRWLVTGSQDNTARVWNLQAVNPAVGAKVIRGHAGRIGCMALSADGRWLVTGSADKTARVWDLQADPAVEAKVLRGHAGVLSYMALSPNGRWLITGSEDKTVRAWDLQATDPSASSRTLQQDKDGIRSATMSVGGQRFAMSVAYGIVHLFDLEATDTPAGKVQGHSGRVRCLALSGDGRWLVTGSDDKTAHIWDLEAADPVAAMKILRGHTGSIDCLALSSDGRWLVTASNNKLMASSDNTIRVWDLQADDPAGGCRVLRGHDNPVEWLALSVDGRWLVTSSIDESPRIWDLQAAGIVAGAKVLEPRDFWPSSLTLSLDGRWLAAGSNDQTARFWDLQAADPAAGGKVLPGHESIVDCIAQSQDGRWLVTGSEKTARVLDLHSREPAAGAKDLRGHEGNIACLTLSPDGRWLMTGSDDKTIRIWDLHASDPASKAKVLRGHTGQIACMTLSRDGRWLITGSWDHTARIWDWQAADPAAGVKVLHGHEREIDCLALSTDDRWLATGSNDETARIWDWQAADPATTAKVLPHSTEFWMSREDDPTSRVKLQPLFSRVRCLAFSPDGRWLITGSGAVVRMWDLQASDLVAASKVLHGHEVELSCLALSTNGRWLATGGSDGTARVWDLQAVNPADSARVLRCQSNQVEYLALSPDARWLVTGSLGTRGSALSVWLLDLEDLREVARAIAGRSLTAEERRRYAIPDTPQATIVKTTRPPLPPFLATSPRDVPVANTPP